MTSKKGDIGDKDFIVEGGIEVSDEMLEEWAGPWERGEVPGTAAGFVPSPGRPCVRAGSSRSICERLSSLDL